MLYIDATVEDFERICNRCSIECFSRPAMAAIVDWYDTNNVDQELDCSDLRGQWDEYTSAAEMWYDYAWTRDFRTCTTPSRRTTSWPPSRPRSAT